MIFMSQAIQNKYLPVVVKFYRGDQILHIFKISVKKSVTEGTAETHAKIYGPPFIKNIMKSVQTM